MTVLLDLHHHHPTRREARLSRFGVWPLSRHVAPLAPTAEVRSWVRSGQIALAKSRGREAANA